MRKKKFFSGVSIILLIIISLMIASCSLLINQNPDLDSSAIIIEELDGIVHIMSDDKLQEISSGTSLVSNQKILTYESSSATVKYPNNSILQLGEFTSLKLLDTNDTESTLLAYLEGGEVWITIEDGTMEIQTDTNIAKVSGSIMHVFFSQVSKNMVVSCLEGTCQVGNILVPVGMKAIFFSDGSSPKFYKLSQDEIDLWIENNPNSTHTLYQLTATAWASISDEEKEKTPMPSSLSLNNTESCELNINWIPKTIEIGDTLPTLAFKYGVSTSELAKSNCITISTKLTEGDVILVPSMTPTPLASTINCGPPIGWITYTIQGEETLDDVAGAFQSTVQALQLSNCLGTSKAVFKGMVLFVPNLIPVTLTPVPTPTPTFVVEKNEVGTGDTEDGTTDESSDEGSSEGSGTDDVLTFSYVDGPSGTITSCVNFYEAHVNDSDHLAIARVVYEFDNSNISENKFFNMVDKGFNGAGDEMFTKSISINTASTPGTTSVYWRFKFVDLKGNVYYDPSLGANPYQFLDNLHCDGAGVPFPTWTFDNAYGPTGGQTSCELDYQITVADADGINLVKIVYSLTDSSLVTIDGEKLMTKLAGTSTKAVYELLDYIISASIGDTVYYRFEMQDQLLNDIADTTIYSYSSINCGAPATYTVLFDSDGGTAVTPLSNVTSGSTISAPVDPTKANYTFDAWYKEVSLTNAWVFVTDTVTANTTLYAGWNINQYTVSFDSNGGSAVGDLTNVDHGDTISAPADPTKTGSTFDAWYSDAGLTTLWNFGSDTVTANTTLYAGWNINQYTVSFDSNGGSAVGDLTNVNHGSTISAPADPTKTGSTFDAWYSDAGLTTLWNFGSDTVTANTMLYAGWTTP